MYMRQKGMYIADLPKTLPGHGIQAEGCNVDYRRNVYTTFMRATAVFLAVRISRDRKPKYMKAQEDMAYVHRLIASALRESCLHERVLYNNHIIIKYIYSWRKRKSTIEYRRLSLISLGHDPINVAWLLRCLFSEMK